MARARLLAPAYRANGHRSSEADGLRRELAAASEELRMTRARLAQALAEIEETAQRQAREVERYIAAQGPAALSCRAGPRPPAPRARGAVPRPISISGFRQWFP
jgi:hypothetical protein